MMNLLAVARNSLAITLALSLGACLSESEDTGSTTDGVSLSITSPTSSSTMDTTDAAVALAGSASSSNGIYQVSWETNSGRKGVAIGTESWEIQNVELELGDNEISVTAEDSAGITASRSVTVKRESGEKGSATLSWVAPTSRVDGSPLSNLAGYKIYYGRMSSTYDYEVNVDNPGVSTYVIEELVSGEWFFSVSAYDTDGLESEPSNEVMRNIT